MMDKIKRFLLHFFVLGVNLALVMGGAFLMKNNQQEKKNAQILADNADANQQEQEIAVKIAELQQIIDNTRNQKIAEIAKNPSEVTVQKPVTVTRTIPAVTKKQTVQKTTKQS